MRTPQGCSPRWLGAAGWHAEVARVDQPAGARRRVMRREGPVWQLEFDGERATVPHAKGLTDIARLIRAADDVNVLDLYGVADRSGGSGDLADRKALEAYRRRRTELDDELVQAHDDADLGRVELFEAQRDELLAEVGRVTGIGGRPRQFANHTERARKAVAGRIRHAIRRLEPSVPELAAHLDRSIVTGIYCRYRPPGDPGARWEISEAKEPAVGDLRAVPDSRERGLDGGSCADGSSARRGSRRTPAARRDRR